LSGLALAALIFVLYTAHALLTCRLSLLDVLELAIASYDQYAHLNDSDSCSKLSAKMKSLGS